MNIEDIKTKYLQHRNQYVMKCAKRLMLDKLTEHLDEGKPLSLEEENKEIKAAVDAQFDKSREKFLDACTQLKQMKEKESEAQSTLTELNQKLESLKRMHGEGTLNKENNDNMKMIDQDIQVKMYVGMSKEEQRAELEKHKAILADLEEQQRVELIKLEKTRAREAELKERLQTLQDEDPSGFNNNTTTDNENIDNENAELIEKIEGLDQRAHLLSRLIIALEKITGLQMLDVIEATNGLQLYMKVGISCEAILYLDKASFRLSGIKIVASATPIDVNKLLIRASKFKTPNDLRFALFALDVQQESQDQLVKDLAELKKKVLVRQTSNFSAQITFSNGIIVDFDVDECYPYIPNGVQLASISGVEGWDESKAAEFKSKMNDDTFHKTVSKFYEALIKELAL